MSKFIVKRASSLSGSLPPIENCRREEVAYISIRTLPSFEDFDKKYERTEGRWIDNGWGHCVNKRGYIQRYEKRECWVVEVETLDDIMFMVEDYGDIIVGYSEYVLPVITIYDYYVE
ncbi:hypothetical protein [Abyssicoccus albus]|uniref:Uncharacterized protein n=1 Tax=Abyssicoccus albus TaxID=1817405 RepID=A0A3N5BBL3_9BACL|nr:hypothetical protein [Abyssicoccus albus]RPF54783.1 hypothetical protein EDD62_1744 [Abyssicoccus albus]